MCLFGFVFKSFLLKFFNLNDGVVFFCSLIECDIVFIIKIFSINDVNGNVLNIRILLI